MIMIQMMNLLTIIKKIETYFIYIILFIKQYKDNYTITYKMTDYSRHGNTWTIPEILRLQREWELLELSVLEIANLHQRTANSIVFKLLHENFATQKQIDSRFYVQDNNLDEVIDNMVNISIKEELCQKKKQVMTTRSMSKQLLFTSNR